MNKNYIRAARYSIAVACAFAALTCCFSMRTVNSSSAGAAAARNGLAGPSANAGNRAASARSAKTAPMRAPETSVLGEGFSLNSFLMVGPSVTATKSHSPAGPFHLGDTITYTVTISDSGADASGVQFSDTPDANTTLVAGSIMASPVAVDDGPYACTGNLSISVPVGSGLLANDFLGLNPAATITAFDATSANGGTVSVTTSGGNAGAFTYEPAAGFSGTDTFTYTLTNTVGSSTGTVTISVSNMVWFINNASSCSSSCDGRFSHPFTTLAAFQAINDGAGKHPKSGDSIFIYQGSSNYTGPLTLLSNQRAIGQGDPANSTTLGFTPAADTNITLPGATAKPTLTGTLTLATGVTALALNLNTGASNALVGSGSLSSVTVGDSSPTSTNGFTVTTTTGTAVNLSGVGGTFTFLSITSGTSGGGPTDGITLTNTTGSFTVTGDGTGTANGSGGTIQNTNSGSSVGINLSSVQNLSLTQMNLKNFGAAAIHGSSVTSFSMSFCTINGASGSTTGQDAVGLTNLLGSGAWSNCSISGGFHNNIHITNSTGTLDRLTVSHCTIGFPQQSADVNDGFQVAGLNGTTTLNLTVDHCTFLGAAGDDMNLGMTDGSSDFVFTNNTVQNGFTFDPVGGGCTFTMGGGGGNPTLDCDIENNTMSGSNVEELTFGKSIGQGTFHGIVNNNTIGVSGSNASGGTVGIEFGEMSGSGTATLDVTNNIIQQYQQEGIFWEPGQQNSTLTGNLTCTGNTIRQPATAGAPPAPGGALSFAIDVEVGAQTGDTNTANVLISGNTLTGNNVGNAIADVGLDNNEFGPPLATHLNLSKNGSTATTPAGVIDALNTVDASPFDETDNGMGTVTLVTTLPPTLMLAPGGVEPADAAKANSASSRSPLPANAILDQKKLDFIVRAARERWIESGLTPDQVSKIKSLSFGVADLDKDYIGASGGGLILFDRKGSGRGWFIDRTPMDDKEFANRVSPTLLYTTPHAGAAGRLDLLTAVMHEMGHRLGLGDANGTGDRGDLMFKALSVGERRLPSKGEAEGADNPQDGQAGTGTEKRYVLRAVAGENADEETRRNAQKLDGASLKWMAQTAIQRWQDAGATPDEIDRMRAADLQTADLPKDELSVTTRNSIQIDDTAAGYGWFIDQTPQDESSFSLFIQDHEYQADRETPAFGHIDLLTVLMNAYGRVAGRNQKHATNEMQVWLMKPWLPTGVRRVPSPAPLEPINSTPDESATEKSSKGAHRAGKGRLMPQSAPVDVVVGTLPASKSVIVKFQVTVNNPLTNPSTATSVSNTGSVSGSNFTMISSNTDTAELCVPPTTTTPLTNQQVAASTTATFTTTLTGSTPFTFVWKKNGATITSGVSLGGRATINTSTTGSSTTSTLTITGTIPSDSDTYTADGTDVAACGDPAVHQSATLTVVSPPTVTKAFSPTTIPVGGTSTITLTIANPNTTVMLTGIGFSDNFTSGSGLQVASTPGIGSSCSATWNASPGDTTLNFGGGTLAPGASCSVTVNVTSTKAGTIMNATNPPASNEGGMGVASNTATLTVVGPPTISKAFELVSQIANSPTGATESGSTVTITTTAAHGFLIGETVTIAGVGVAGYNGTFTIGSVPSTTTFTYTDGTTGLASSGGGTATASLSTMPLNGTATLAFTLTNPNPTSLSGISFTDALPAGLQVAATPNASAPCGTFAPNAGDTTLTFSAGTIAASGTCTVMVDVTATTAGTKNNVTSAVTSTEGGMGSTASASVTVLSPPSISKAFGVANIPPNGTTTLTFTITNPNASNQLLGVGFTDSLPSGLQVAATPGASTSCGGTFAPSAGDTSLTFSGGTIAGGGTCTVAVNVTGTTGGVKNNTTGNVTSANAGTGNTATASISVASPPSISKAFNPTTIPLNGTSTLTFTITNPNLSTSLTGVGFTDALPSGLQVAATPGASASCGGTFAPNAGDTTLTFSGGTIAASGTCTVAVNVTGTTAGVKNNVSGAVTSNEGGSGNTATATLTVVAPPVFSKEFVQTALIAPAPNGATESGSTVTITTVGPHNLSTGELVAISGVAVGGYNGETTITSTPTPTTLTYADPNTGLPASGGGTVIALTPTGVPVVVNAIPLNGFATLMFLLTNPNTTTTLHGVSFTDNLTGGLQVAAMPNAFAECGTFSPAPGDTALSFSGGVIAPIGGCAAEVLVTGTAAGVITNTTGNVTSTESGPGGTASASITVVGPPSISKAFGAPNIPLNGTTSLTFTITNPNTTQQLTGVGFTDALPSGVQVAATPGASTSCGGTFAPNAGDTTLTFSGGTIAASGTCTVSVNVTGTTAGVKNNTTSAVTSNEGGTGTTSNTASLGVASAPTISKAFGASSILAGQTTSLQFTITNPNSSLGLTGVSFTDTLPAGLTVGNGTTTTCGGGTVTTTAPGTITLTGGTIAASGTCSFSVTVTGATTGVWNNTTGAVSSNESGAGTTSNTATLTVIGPPAISKGFDATTIPLSGTSVLTFTITNPNTTTTLNGVAFTDTLPSGLTVPNGTSTTCGGGTLTTTAPDTIALAGGSIASSSNCVITVTVTGTTAGVKNNTTGTVSASNGGTGSASNTATITVVAPPTISKAFGAPNIPLNGTTSLTFTVTNPNATVALAGVAVTDTLPAGLTVANSTSTTCGGGTLTTSGTNTIMLTGGSVAEGGTCTFSVTVTGTTGGVKNNTTGAVSSTNGGTGTTSNTATVTVATPPTVSKSFGAATIPLGGATMLTFSITNTNSTLGITGVSFTDTLPPGLTVPNGTMTTCGGGTITITGNSTIALTGGSIAGGGSCTFHVTVTGTTAGVQNNTTGAISANETGTGTTSNTAMLTVVAPPTIAKAFGAATVPLNQTTSLTFTITNPNSTVGLTGVGFSDTLPAGLTVATGTAMTCGGGTVTTTAPNLISLSAGSIAASGNCLVTVTVTGATAGVQNNTTGAVTSANGGTGTTSNTATITVVAPPQITKAFGSATVPVGQTTTLTFTLKNPNATVALTGVGFTDAFPAGLVVANPANATDSCGGTFAPNPGDMSLTFSGGTIAAGGSCTLTVVVKVTTGGTKTNTTGAVTSGNGGTGGTGTATVVTFDKCLRDDTSGDFIQFSSITGDYLFTHCGPPAVTLQGTGTVSVVSGVLTIIDKKPDRRVKIGYYTGQLTGTATVTIINGGVSQTFKITDTNPHPICSCAN